MRLLSLRPERSASAIPPHPQAIQGILKNTNRESFFKGDSQDWDFRPKQVVPAGNQLICDDSPARLFGGRHKDRTCDLRDVNATL